MAATHMRLTYNAVIRGDFTVSRFAHKIGRSPCAKRLTVKLSGSLPCYETKPWPSKCNELCYVRLSLRLSV